MSIKTYSGVVGFWSLGYSPFLYFAAEPKALSPIPSFQESEYVTTSFSYAPVGYFGIGRPIPLLYERIIIPPGPGTEIRIESVSGAFIGNIRTDIQYPIIRSLEFSLDSKGCAEGRMVFNRLPDFAIPPFAVVKATLYNTAFSWYAGYINRLSLTGSEQSEYEYEIKGLRSLLESLDGEFSTVEILDLGQIVFDIASALIAGNSAIRFNPAKIETSTGILISAVDHTGEGVNRLLDDLVNGTGFEWGVDGEGEFYFREGVNVQRQAFFAGWDMQSMDIEINPESIINSLTYGRKAGGSGWNPIGVLNDVASQRSYGVRYDEYISAINVTDSEIQDTAAAILEQRKDPQPTIRIDRKPLRGPADHIPTGRYTAVAPFQEYEDVYFSGENTASVFGNIDVSEDEDFVYTPPSALKIQYGYPASSQGDRIEIDNSLGRGVIAIRVHIRSEVAGNFLTLGIGSEQWGEYTTDLSIPVSQQYYVFEWRPPISPGDKINKIGLRIDHDIENILYLDSIVVNRSYYKRYELSLSRAMYVTGIDNYVDVELGEGPPRLERYIQQLSTESKEAKQLLRSTV